MSAKKTKELRSKFERQHGFTLEDRGGELYKAVWRKYKKAVKR